MYIKHSKWSWFAACLKTDFVNCWFKGDGGTCQNPRHRDNWDKQ